MILSTLFAMVMVTHPIGKPITHTTTSTHKTMKECQATADLIRAHSKLIRDPLDAYCIEVQPSNMYK